MRYPPYVFSFNRLTVLFLDDLKDAHRAGLCADAAGDALRCDRRFRCLDHDMHRAYFYALAAARAELLIDDIRSLCVLLDRALFAGTCALAALQADIDLRLVIFAGYDADAGLVRIEYFVKNK